MANKLFDIQDEIDKLNKEKQDFIDNMYDTLKAEADKKQEENRNKIIDLRYEQVKETFRKNGIEFSIENILKFIIQYEVMSAGMGSRGKHLLIHEKILDEKTLRECTFLKRSPLWEALNE